MKQRRRVLCIDVSYIRQWGMSAAALLAQLEYWSSRTRDPEGWIYKSAEEFSAETGLSYYQQKAARAVLRKAGIIEEMQKASCNRVLYFRISPERKAQLGQLDDAPVGDAAISETPTSDVLISDAPTAGPTINEGLAITAEPVQKDRADAKQEADAQLEPHLMSLSTPQSEEAAQGKKNTPVPGIVGQESQKNEEDRAISSRALQNQHVANAGMEKFFVHPQVLHECRNEKSVDVYSTKPTPELTPEPTLLQVNDFRHIADSDSFLPEEIMALEEVDDAEEGVQPAWSVQNEAGGHVQRGVGRDLQDGAEEHAENSAGKYCQDGAEKSEDVLARKTDAVLAPGSPSSPRSKKGIGTLKHAVEADIEQIFLSQDADVYYAAIAKQRGALRQLRLRAERHSCGDARKILQAILAKLRMLKQDGSLSEREQSFWQSIPFCPSGILPHYERLLHMVQQSLQAAIEQRSILDQQTAQMMPSEDEDMDRWVERFTEREKEAWDARLSR